LRLKISPDGKGQTLQDKHSSAATDPQNPSPRHLRAQFWVFRPIAWHDRKSAKLTLNSDSGTPSKASVFTPQACQQQLVIETTSQFKTFLASLIANIFYNGMILPRMVMKSNCPIASVKRTVDFKGVSTCLHHWMHAIERS
jgi:hypothetical protein